MHVTRLNTSVEGWVWNVEGKTCIKHPLALWTVTLHPNNWFQVHTNLLCPQSMSGRASGRQRLASLRFIYYSKTAQKPSHSPLFTHWLWPFLTTGLKRHALLYDFTLRWCIFLVPQLSSAFSVIWRKFPQTPFTLSIDKTQIPRERNPGGSEVAASDTTSIYLAMQQSKADNSGWVALLWDVIQGPGTPSILWLLQVQHVALKTFPGVEPARKEGAHGGLHVVLWCRPGLVWIHSAHFPLTWAGLMLDHGHPSLQGSFGNVG